MKLKLPPEYPKPRFVVPDRLVEAFREAFGDAAEIIPVSETLLEVEPPRDPSSGTLFP